MRKYRLLDELCDKMVNIKYLHHPDEDGDQELQPGNLYTENVAIADVPDSLVCSIRYLQDKLAERMEHLKEELREDINDDHYILQNDLVIKLCDEELDHGEYVRLLERHSECFEYNPNLKEARDEIIRLDDLSIQLTAKLIRPLDELSSAFEFEIDNQNKYNKALKDMDTIIHIIDTAMTLLPSIDFNNKPVYDYGQKHEEDELSQAAGFIPEMVASWDAIGAEIRENLTRIRALGQGDHRERGR